ncbi:helix-turn-helix domain-containing protein, partial [Acinetobacter baumannii]
SYRNKKWLKRALLAILIIAVVSLIVMGVQKWTSNKEEADVPKANQSNVEVLPMKGSASATAGDQLVLNFNRPTSVHIVD